MTRPARILSLLLILSICCAGHAQKLCTDFGFDGLFDNREYKADMLPQTIYGVRITPQIGVDHRGNCIMAGFSSIIEFGAQKNPNPDLTLYYMYRGEKWSTLFGKIPRSQLMRQLPDAFLYDSIAFYEPNFGGTLIRYKGNLLETELYCNWFSRQSYTDREAFRIVWDGLVQNLVTGVGWYAAMTHFAKPKEAGHFIYEKFQFNPYLSVDVLPGMIAPNFSFKLHAGLLCSMVRCRKDGEWFTPTGFLGDVQVGWRKFDVKSTLYAGGAQQPYLADSEAGMAFHRSDPFYNHTMYNKTELGVKFVSNSNIELGFRWNLHFTPDSPVHNQQLFTVKYRFNTPPYIFEH